MSIKDRVVRRSIEFLQRPTIMRIVADERVMNTLMASLRMRGRVLDEIDGRVANIADALNLATKQEVRELKRTIRQLQQELAQTRSE